MTALLKCRSCRHHGNCEIADRLLAAVKGLRVTSIRHICPKHELLYRPGQAVWAYVFQGSGIADPAVNWEYSGAEVAKGWFPGHFIGQSNRGEARGLVFIKAGVEDRYGEAGEFEPTKAEGVCKTAWSRIGARDAPDMPVCCLCGQIEGMRCQEPGGYTGATKAICPVGKVDDGKAAENVRYQQVAALAKLAKELNAYMAGASYLETILCRDCDGHIWERKGKMEECSRCGRSRIFVRPVEIQEVKRRKK